MNTRLSFKFVIGGKVRRSVSETWGSPVTRVKRYTQWICKAAERQLFLGPEDMELRTDLCPIIHRSRIHEPPSIPFLQVQNKKRKLFQTHPHSLRVVTNGSEEMVCRDCDPENFSTVTIILPARACRETVAEPAATTVEKENI
jgi:hypothetical protein